MRRHFRRGTEKWARAKSKGAGGSDSLRSSAKDQSSRVPGALSIFHVFTPSQWLYSLRPLFPKCGYVKGGGGVQIVLSNAALARLRRFVFSSSCSRYMAAGSRRGGNRPGKAFACPSPPDPSRRSPQGQLMFFAQNRAHVFETRLPCSGNNSTLEHERHI